MKYVSCTQAVLVFISLVISGCSTVFVERSHELDSTRYQRAISDAAVIEPAEIASLPILSENMVKVVTWTKYPQSYQPGQEVILSWGEVWVTLDNDVKSRCQTFSKETLTTGIQQLLGLPPKKDERRSFITLEVETTSLFRPCANPSLREETCSEKFPEDVSEDHMAWYAKQSSNSYQTATGYPWTRLGYTYNWKAGANEIGVAEFVMKKGSKAVTISVQDTESYCAKL